MDIEKSAIKTFLADCDFDLDFMKSFSSAVSGLHNLMLFIIGIPQVKS